MISKWADIMEGDATIAPLSINREFLFNIIDYCDSKWFYLGDKGFCGCSFSKDLMNNNVCHEIVIYLKPEHRNIRNFKKLLDFIEKEAQNNKCNKVVLSSNVLYKNEKVLNLYRRFGYKKTVSLAKEIF